MGLQHPERSRSVVFVHQAIVEMNIEGIQSPINEGICTVRHKKVASYLLATYYFSLTVFS